MYKRQHLALATADLPAARRYLEEKGFSFDEESIKHFSDGRRTAAYIGFTYIGKSNIG